LYNWLHFCLILKSYVLQIRILIIFCSNVYTPIRKTETNTFTFWMHV
jgi:hypothetical protein